ncbi:hypothetical protein [Streptomyces sp. NPDC048341]|uniref:hypothetical protein n=1 Tax=unclassified Streptomyces TaxID=2593676 RepID=UPI00341AF799
MRLKRLDESCRGSVRSWQKHKVRVTTEAAIATVTGLMTLLENGSVRSSVKAQASDRNNSIRRLGVRTVTSMRSGT